MSTEAKDLRRGIEQCLQNTVDVLSEDAPAVLEGLRKSLYFLLERIVDDSRGFSFAVWPKDGSETEARAYYASSASQAAEQRANDDCKADRYLRRSWPVAYSVRNNVSGEIWLVHVNVVISTAVIAQDACEIPMQPATHVLWGGSALCKDLRLQGVPRDWPAQQSWISLKDVADGMEDPPDRCEGCWVKVPDLVAEIRQIGKR